MINYFREFHTASSPPFVPEYVLQNLGGHRLGEYGVLFQKISEFFDVYDAVDAAVDLEVDFVEDRPPLLHGDGTRGRRT